MSGGSYDYKYCVIGDYYIGNMYDVELNEMISDLVEVLHDVEWWQSGDISEESYRETATKFKKKWFKRDKTQVKNVIDSVFEKEKQELYATFKYLEE